MPSITDWQQETMDRNNTYDYERYTYQSDVMLKGMYQSYREGKKLECEVELPLSYTYRKLYYHKQNATFTPSQRSLLPQPKMTLSYATHEWRYRYTLTYQMSSTQPSINYLVETIDNTNPLIVSYGNPNLKDRYTHHTALTFDWTIKEKEQIFHAGLSHGQTQNAVSMYTLYDRNTGQRILRPENVNGNYNLSGNLSFSSPLDKKKFLTLRTNTTASYHHSVDLTVSNENKIPRSIVNSLYLTEDINMYFRYRKYKVGIRLKGTYGKVASPRTELEKLHVGDVVYGLNGQIKLPGKLQLNTDLNLYCRYKYNNPEMNRNDLVWNARLSRSAWKNKILLMIDGYDILGNLSNMSYSMNAQGHVETYRNVIPRYIMLHAVYRMNIKPKKRPGDA